MSNYIDTAIADELATLRGTAAGGRNAQLFKSAAALFGLARGNGLDQDSIRAQLESTAQSIGLASSEIQKTLNSAWKSAEPRPVNGHSAEAENTTSKRAYQDFADYAQAHGVEASVYSQAGWEWATHANRPCLRYGKVLVNDQPLYRYRFMDGKEPRFKHDSGYPVRWYGLDKALEADPNVLVLCNGAPSVVAAQHWGVPACAQEGHGENAFTPECLTELKTKWQGTLYICLEADAQGKQAAEKWQAQLPNAKRIDMGLTGSQDLADFCKLYQQGSLAELQRRATAQPSDTVSVAIQTLARNAQAGKVVKMGLQSHIPGLDSAVGSFRPYRMHTILADTGMGKSTLAVSLATAFLWQSPGLMVTTETSPEMWFDKMVAYLAQVPVDKIIEDTCSPEEKRRVREKQALLEPSRSRIYDGDDPDVDDVIAWMKDWQQKMPLQWVVIDCVSLLTAKGKHSIFDRTTEVSRALRRFTRASGLVMVGTSQVGRKLEGRAVKVPGIHDGYGSGALEQDADVILPLYYHHHYVVRNMIDPTVGKNKELTLTMPAGKAMVYVGKHRYRSVSGRSIWLQFKGGIGFYEWQESEQTMEGVS